MCGVLTAQDSVVVTSDQDYQVDFSASAEGWWHARPDYGHGGWNSQEGLFEMTCTSLDGNGLGNIIQRPYFFFGEDGQYEMKFRIKTDDPVDNFRVTVADYTGVQRSSTHDFSIKDALGAWKEYSLTFSTEESGNGYDEPDITAMSMQEAIAEAKSLITELEKPAKVEVR